MVARPHPRVSLTIRQAQISEGIFSAVKAFGWLIAHFASLYVFSWSKRLYLGRNIILKRVSLWAGFKIIPPRVPLVLPCRPCGPGALGGLPNSVLEAAFVLGCRLWITLHCKSSGPCELTPKDGRPSLYRARRRKVLPDRTFSRP